jgi:hypothetical protein
MPGGKRVAASEELAVSIVVAEATAGAGWARTLGCGLQDFNHDRGVRHGFETQQSRGARMLVASPPAHQVKNSGNAEVR